MIKRAHDAGNLVCAGNFQLVISGSGFDSWYSIKLYTYVHLSLLYIGKDVY